MQQNCSILRLNKCIWESWLTVVFVVCPLGGNVHKDLFYQKRVFFDTFQCSIQFRKSHKKFNIYNIFCIINKNWTFLIEQYWFKCILFLTFFHFCVLPAWWKHTQRPLLTKLEAFESSKFEKIEKADFAHFVSCSLGGNVPKDIFWQNQKLLKALSLEIF